MPRPGCARGCLRTALGLLVLGAAAYGGFRWGDRVFPALERFVERGSEGVGAPVPSPALGTATLERVDDLRSGRLGSNRLELGGTELTSVVRYSLPGALPAGVSEPGVALRGDEVHLSARVALSAFPSLPGLSEVVGFLPDTVNIQMRGAVLPFGRRVAALHVVRAEASGVPLPGRLVPGILTALGRRPLEGLPSDALAVPLPEGIVRAYVEGGSLILVAEG
ncbi:MAG: hypothetical protein RQ751_13820 [Longimicrobiales bacterium]|nr:hypothetical protein [Longimicrobiales bacterium]